MASRDPTATPRSGWRSRLLGLLALAVAAVLACSAVVAFVRNDHYRASWSDNIRETKELRFGFAAFAVHDTDSWEDETRTRARSYGDAIAEGKGTIAETRAKGFPSVAKREEGMLAPMNSLKHAGNCYAVALIYGAVIAVWAGLRLRSSWAWRFGLLLSSCFALAGGASYFIAAARRYVETNLKGGPRLGSDVTSGLGPMSGRLLVLWAAVGAACIAGWVVGRWHTPGKRDSGVDDDGPV